MSILYTPSKALLEYIRTKFNVSPDCIEEISQDKEKILCHVADMDITTGGLDRTRPGEWFNDSLIKFWTYHIAQSLYAEKKDKCKICTTQILALLADDRKEE